MIRQKKKLLLSKNKNFGVFKNLGFAITFFDSKVKDGNKKDIAC